MERRRFVFPPKKILVPLDLTEASEPAWRTAKRLGSQFRARVEGLLVRESFFYPEMPPSPLDLAGTMKELRDKLDAGEDEIGTAVGTPDWTILNWGKSLDFDLIVMGTHGRTGLSRVLLGSVAEAVVRRSAVPVLVVRKPLGRMRTVLAPVNFTPHGEAGLIEAAQVAHALGARLHVLHVVDAPVYGGAGALKAARHLLADFVNRLPAEAHAAGRARTEIVFGDAAEEIVRAARHADLVALSAHRRGFLDEALLGTTSERVLRHCQTPVLALPSSVPARGKGRAAKAAAQGAAS